jgi:flagellar protein FliO/FliZ
VPEPEARPIPPPASTKPDSSRPGAAAPSAEAAGQSPFSVEEIEAEFARLLGRPLDKKG